MSGFFKENPADTVVGSPDADETQISEDAAEVNDISSAFYKGSDNRTQVEAEEQSAREAREAAEAAQAAAEASQASAATSSTNAASSASSASSSEAAAAVSATNAANSATSASTSASNAATSASNSATNATSAANSATAASTSASSAATSETAASTSAINAASSASSAASAQAAAEAAYDDFDDRYLGAKTSDPSTDNDGNSLVTGALYFNTTDNIMKVYNGTAWLSVAASLSGALLASNNLSDVVSASAARTNLGLVDVASTGDYSDLFGTPTAVSAFTNDAGYLVSDSDGSDLQNVRAETVEVTLKNVSGASIAKGTPVHQTGTSGSSTFEVIPSLAGTASTMPAHFVAAEAIADQAEGRGILMGRITGVDTSSFAEGDTIYVGASGGYTNTAPTGEGNLVQNLGTVTRVDATHGGGEVFGAGRSNATPNLNNGNIFIGNASNQAATASLSSSVSGLSHYNNTNWDTAYGWGNHALAGYLTSYTETDPTVPAHVKSITTGNISNWNTAYGWGDHSAAGYLTSFTETDPTVPSHVKSITTTNISNWNTAYGWGDHSAAGYLTSFSETDPTVPSHVKSITTTNISNWNTAYGWGDHAAAGYQAAATALTTSTAFGGDVSGTYNAIVVADDSHNHVISNVDGLQAALDGKLSTTGKAADSNLFDNLDSVRFVYGSNQYATSDGRTDINNLSKTGHYWSSSATNKPSTGNGTTFHINHDGGTSYATQMFINHDGNDGAYFRAKDAGTWNSWQRIFSDDYHPNADTLTTARTISLTGDVSGSVSFNGSANVSISTTVVDDSHGHSFNNLLNKTSGTGTYTTSGDFRAPIFYDSANTAKFIDPASTSKVGSDNSYIQIGTSESGKAGVIGNTSTYDGTNLSYGTYWAYDSYYNGSNWAALRTSLGRKWMVDMGYHVNKFRVRAYGGTVSSPWADSAWSNVFTVDSAGQVEASGDFRAPIFYDSANTSYYVDPASGSYVSGEFAVKQSGINGFRIYSPTGTQSLWVRAGYDTDGTGTPISSPTNIQFQSSGSSGGSLTFVSGNTKALTVSGDYAQGAGSLRAPLFYDSDNTGYYVDPASTANLNIVNANRLCRANGTTAISLDNSVYTQFRDPSGSVKLWLGNNDTSYYNNNTHYFRNSASTINLTIDSGGNAIARGSHRAPIFYDSDNTGFNLNASGSAWQLQTPTGYLRAGPMNTSYCHFNTDRPRFYFDKEVQFDNGINDYSGNWRFNDSLGQHDVSLRSPLFYDSNNTGYYIHGDSTSNLNALTLASNLSLNNGNIFGPQYINMRYGSTGAGGLRLYDSDGTLQSYWYGDGSGRGGLLDNDGAWAVKVGIGTEGLRLYCNSNEEFIVNENHTLAVGSSRAPLFYDSNNTAYYADLGSTGSSIRTAGPVSVGTTSSAVQLTVAGAAGVDGIDLQVDTTNSVNSGRMFWTNGTAGQGVAIYNGSGNMYLTTGATPNSTSGGTRLAIYSGNYVTASGSFRAPVFYDSNNTGRYADLSSTGDSIRASGDIVAYYSDDRLKDRGDNIANALDKVQSLNGFHYTANETAQKFGYKANPQVGVSAQEVEAVLPEVVKEAAIGHGYKTVDYAKLVPLLIEAIKELKAEVETLKKG